MSFKIGDKVRVKFKEEMVKEFGSLDRVRCGFAPKMYNACGAVDTIIDISKNESIILDNGTLARYDVSTDMITHYKPVPTLTNQVIDMISMKIPGRQELQKFLTSIGEKLFPGQAFTSTEYSRLHYGSKGWCGINRPTASITFQEFKDLYKNEVIKMNISADITEYCIKVGKLQTSTLEAFKEKLTTAGYSVSFTPNQPGKYIVYKVDTWCYTDKYIRDKTITYTAALEYIKGATLKAVPVNITNLRKDTVNLTNGSKSQLEALQALFESYKENIITLGSSYPQPTFLRYYESTKRWSTVADQPDDYLNIDGFISEHQSTTKNSVKPVKLPAAPIVKWRNPSPKIKNTLSLDVGDKVLITGMTLPSIIQSVDATTIKIKGSKRSFLKTKVYPLLSHSIDNIRVGDIINVYHTPSKTLIYDQVVEINNDQLTTITSLYSIFDVHRVHSNRLLPGTVTKYKCDTLVFNSKKYASLATLQRANPTFDMEIVPSVITYDHSKITTHYNVTEDQLIAKDITIDQELNTALDHPLNAEAKEWALLVGASGTGKTEACIKYAASIKRPYVKLQGSAQLTVDDLQGYKSITTGTYFPSLLRDAVETGKLFILDEIDACNPNTLLSLNGLKQSHYQFPDKLVAVHPDFRFVATANTLEYNEVYNARNPMDKATIARFKVIKYEMEPHQLALRYGLKYIKSIAGIEKLTAREVAREVTGLKIKEMKETK